MHQSTDGTGIIRFVAASAAGLVAFGLVGFLFLSERPLVSVVFHGSALIGLVLVLVLERAGRSWLASRLMLVLFWVIFSVACALFGGIHSSPMAGYLLVVLAAGLLLGGHAALAAAVLSSLAALGMVWAEARGLLPEPILSQTASFDWVSWTMYFGMAVALLRVALRGRDDALREARRHSSALKATLEELRRTAVSKAFVEDIVRNMGDAVMVVGTSGRIRSANQAALRMLSCGESDLVGLPGDTLLGGPIPSESGETIWRTRSGEPVVVSMSIATLRDAVGSDRGKVWIGHDLTARARLEQKLREATERADAASQAKSRFLANMSHELRTPLNAIIGYAEMMLEEGAASAAVEDIDRIRRASRGLLSIINDILDLSKIEAGRMEVEHRPVDLAALMQEVVEVMAPLVAANHNALRIEIAPELPRVATDGLRVRQIVTNLIANATKFTTGGEVRVSIERSEAAVRLVVADTGIGMDADQLERVFEPFVQADDSTTRRFGGTGLGLAISRRLTELLGGRLWAESAVGVGSRFAVELPLDPPG